MLCPKDLKTEGEVDHLKELTKESKVASHFPLVLNGSILSKPRWQAKAHFSQPKNDNTNTHTHIYILCICQFSSKILFQHYTYTQRDISTT